MLILWGNFAKSGHTGCMERTKNQNSPLNLPTYWMPWYGECSLVIIVWLMIDYIQISMEQKIIIFQTWVFVFNVVVVVNEEVWMQIQHHEDYRLRRLVLNLRQWFALRQKCPKFIEQLFSVTKSLDYHRWNYHCAAGLQFYSLEIYQTKIILLFVSS